LQEVSAIHPFNKDLTVVRSVSLILAACLVSTVALAQSPYEGSAEDRACRADARRFCRDDIPDQFKIASCLQAHRNRLSRGCKAMLQSHGM
jgi:hypothetical protein